MKYLKLGEIAILTHTSFSVLDSESDQIENNQFCGNFHIWFNFQFQPTDYLKCILKAMHSHLYVLPFDANVRILLHFFQMSP